MRERRAVGAPERTTERVILSRRLATKHHPRRGNSSLFSRARGSAHEEEVLKPTHKRGNDLLPARVARHRLGRNDLAAIGRGTDADIVHQPLVKSREDVAIVRKAAPIARKKRCIGHEATAVPSHRSRFRRARHHAQLHLGCSFWPAEAGRVDGNVCNVRNCAIVEGADAHLVANHATFPIDESGPAEQIGRARCNAQCSERDGAAFRRSAVDEQPVLQTRRANAGAREGGRGQDELSTAGQSDGRSGSGGSAPSKKLSPVLLSRSVTLWVGMPERGSPNPRTHNLTRLVLVSAGAAPPTTTSSAAPAPSQSRPSPCSGGVLSLKKRSAGDEVTNPAAVA
eukprot:scaffold31545_cov69-Phaeocystis_antarctica.AAC.1